MAGRLIDGIKYIKLMNDNNFKKKSLEDNVYFTLRDIFMNIRDFDRCISANYYNGILTNDVSFEERDSNFRYSNVLYDYNLDFTKKLYNWIEHLSKYKHCIFDFDKPEEQEEIDMSKYMNYDEWWEQFIDLREKLKEQLEKHKLWEAEDEFPCGEEILDGGPGSYPEWLNE